MRILLCNKYFFLNGGVERYIQGIMEALPQRGHEVIPFSVAYAGNWPSDYAEFFLPPPGPADARFFKDIKPSPRSLVLHAERSIYSFAARRCLDRLLEHVGGADVGYLLNIYNYMSPSVVHSFRKRNIPVVVNFGDYHTLCANYTFLRDNKPCILCRRGAYYNGVIHKCVKNSLSASVLRVFSMYVQKWLRLYQSADAFVVPCNFMREQLTAGGFDPERIHVNLWPAIPSMPLENTADTPKEDFVLFFGRISREKGLDVLVEAWQRLRPRQKLVLAGRSYDGCEDELRAMILPDMHERIVFPGFLQGQDLARSIAAAQLSVVPSRWYDNAPLSIYESYLQGTPVLAANIGGIPEQVRPGVTGDLFTPEDPDDLALALERLLAAPEELERMGREAKIYALNDVSMDRHLDDLLLLFNTLT